MDIPYNISMEKDLLDITKQEIADIQPIKCLNINVGVLGHVDSGKTSLCRSLS
jgi:selenocysteine-specific elongation factor